MTKKKRAIKKDSSATSEEQGLVYSIGADFKAGRGKERGSFKILELLDPYCSNLGKYAGDIANAFSNGEYSLLRVLGAGQPVPKSSEADQLLTLKKVFGMAPNRLFTITDANNFLAYLQGNQSKNRKLYGNILEAIKDQSIILFDTVKDGTLYKIAECIKKRYPKCYIPFSKYSWSFVFGDKAVFAAVQQCLSMKSAPVQKLVDMTDFERFKASVFAEDGIEDVIIKPLYANGGQGCFRIPKCDIGLYFRVIKKLKDIIVEIIDEYEAAGDEYDFMGNIVARLLDANPDIGFDKGEAMLDAVTFTLFDVIGKYKDENLSRYFLVQQYIEFAPYGKHLKPEIEGGSTYESKGRVVCSISPERKASLQALYFTTPKLPISGDVAPEKRLAEASISGAIHGEEGRIEQTFKVKNNEDTIFKLFLKEEIELLIGFVDNLGEGVAGLVQKLMGSPDVDSSIKRYIQSHPELGAHCREISQDSYGDEKQAGLFGQSSAGVPVETDQGSAAPIPKPK